MHSHGFTGSHSNIAKRLGDELDHAIAEFMRVERIQSAILQDAPSGIPLPDGQFRIMQAAKEVRIAFALYQLAVKRYRDFVDDGIAPIPEKEREDQ